MYTISEIVLDKLIKLNFKQTYIIAKNLLTLKTIYIIIYIIEFKRGIVYGK